MHIPVCFAKANRSLYIYFNTTFTNSNPNFQVQARIVDSKQNETGTPPFTKPVHLMQPASICFFLSETALPLLTWKPESDIMSENKEINRKNSLFYKLLPGVSR